MNAEPASNKAMYPRLTANLFSNLLRMLSSVFFQQSDVSRRRLWRWLDEHRIKQL